MGSPNRPHPIYLLLIVFPNESCMKKYRVDLLANQHFGETNGHITSF